MILYLDAFDNGSDAPGFTANGFYLVTNKPKIYLIVKCASMLSPEYNVLYHKFADVNLLINRSTKGDTQEQE